MPKDTLFSFTSDYFFVSDLYSESIILKTWTELGCSFSILHRWFQFSFPH